jgi:hypothetical protein
VVSRPAPRQLEQLPAVLHVGANDPPEIDATVSCPGVPPGLPRAEAPRHAREQRFSLHELARSQIGEIPGAQRFGAAPRARGKRLRHGGGIRFVRLELHGRSAPRRRCHAWPLAEREKRQAVRIVPRWGPPEPVECLVEERHIVAAVDEKTPRRGANIAAAPDADTLDCGNDVGDPAGVYVQPRSAKQFRKAEHIRREGGGHR